MLQKISKPYQCPLYDIQKMIEEDEKTNMIDSPFRFGKDFNVNLGLSDGMWTNMSCGGRLWALEIVSPKAFSINFIFSDFYLPEGAFLYIVNKDRTVLYGPVTQKENTSETLFLTDLIAGDNVIIYLFEPKNKLGLSTLNIKKVIHAYKDISINGISKGYGASGSCNNDINCFPDWNMESNAIALVILSSGKEICSGALLTNTNNDFKPFFLTAFHCIDTSKNGELSDNEISVAENWMFKFQYKKEYCNGNSPTIGVSYNGANFRAVWQKSDFALMELNNQPTDKKFTWLGWDRSGNIPSSGTGIHHPKGDVMKISFDNDQIIETKEGETTPGYSHWFVNIDNGTFEKGSSGSPLFDQNKRVVGQLHSGLPGCFSPKKFWYGCLHRSWTGGGTYNTRLSNWLDPKNTGLLTTNSSHYIAISGPSTICEQATYNIINPIVGSTVQWSVSENLSIVPGSMNDSTITISASDNFTNGKINATVMLNNGSTINLFPKLINSERNAGPIHGPFNSVTHMAEPPNSNNTYYFTAENIPSYVPEMDITWELTPPVGFSSLYYGRNPLVGFAGGGNHTIQMNWYGNCGLSHPAEKSFYVSGPSIPDPKFIHTPNPASDIVTLSWIEPENEGVYTTQQTNESEPYEIQVWNNVGMVKQFFTNENNFQIPIHDLPSGLYFIHVIINGERFVGKLIVN